MSPIPTEGGYFLLVDIAKCRSFIPPKYFQSHDYEEDKSGEPILKYRFSLPDGTIPMDFAFCRWLAVERRVTIMPCSLFYQEGSSLVVDHLVRFSFAKGKQFISKAINRLAYFNP